MRIVVVTSKVASVLSGCHFRNARMVKHLWFVSENFLAELEQTQA